MGETPGKMYALATVLTLLATIAVLLRFYARKIKNARIEWDDYLIVFALVRRFPRLRVFGLAIECLSSDRSAKNYDIRCSRLELRCVCLLVGT